MNWRGPSSEICRNKIFWHWLTSLNSKSWIIRSRTKLFNLQWIMGLIINSINEILVLKLICQSRAKLRSSNDFSMNWFTERPRIIEWKNMLLIQKTSVWSDVEMEFANWFGTILKLIINFAKISKMYGVYSFVESTVNS